MFANAQLWYIVSPSPVTSTEKGLPLCEGQVKISRDWYHKSLQFGLVSFQICPVAFTLSHHLCHCVIACVCCRKSMCAFVTYHPVPHGALRSHTVKKRCPEVGCPFPTGSPFQQLEIPLRTKRPDMIPQHCRRGRELGTVLIRKALLSGKILKGMQPIVVNCMGPHSIPSAAGMCYLFWIWEISILTADQCLCFVLVSPFGSVDCALFFSWGCINLLKLTCNNIICSHSSAMPCFIVHIHIQLILILPAGFCAFTHLNVLLKAIYWYLSTLTKFPLVLSLAVAVLEVYSVL